MTAAVGALLLLVFSVLELWLGNWHLQLPLVADLVFYLTIAVSWRSGLFTAVLGGALLDLLWGGGGVCAPSFSLLVLAARLWARNGFDAPLPMNMIAGFAIPFALLLLTSFFRLFSGGALPIFSVGGWSGALLSGAANSWLLYLIIVLADKLAMTVGMSGFAAAALRRRRRTGEE